MKNVIIIHGCPSDKEKAMDAETRTYDKHWMPWLKEQLTALDMSVETPSMPNPWEPSYEAFKSEFEKYPVTEDSTLIGHSCGCAFVVRWLSETNQKINKLILVAPWKVAEDGTEIKKAFYEYPINEGIKSNITEIVMFTADDEDDIGKDSLKMYNDALGGKVIELNNHGHYTMGDMGTMEFPELLTEVTKK